MRLVVMGGNMVGLNQANGIWGRVWGLITLAWSCLSARFVVFVSVFFLVVLAVFSAGRVVAADLYPVCGANVSWVGSSPKLVGCSAEWVWKSAGALSGSDVLVGCRFAGSLSSSLSGVGWWYASGGSSVIACGPMEGVVTTYGGADGRLAWVCRDGGTSGSLNLGGGKYGASCSYGSVGVVDVASFRPDLVGLSSGGGGGSCPAVRRSHSFNWMLMRDVLGNP